MMWLLGWCRKKTIEKDQDRKPLGSTKQTTEGRPLGNTEQFLLNIGRKGAAHLTRAVILSSERPTSLQSVEIALSRLAERHPLLRMKVSTNGTDNDWFIPMDKMEVLVEELPDKSWLDVMEQQLSESKINVEEGPLWHVKFLPNINTEDTYVNLPHQFALIFVFDHAICDGGSMIRLINETLLCLEDEMSGVRNIDTIKSLPLPKPSCDLTDIEHRLPLSLKVVKLLISWLPFIVGGIVKRLTVKGRSEWIMKINNNLIPPAVIPATKIIPIIFNQSETTWLMKACKTHNVSPFAAFQAALLTILKDKLSLPEEIEFNITVDLRSYYAKSEEDDIFQQAVSYATFLSCKTRIPKQHTCDFWTLAKYCKHAVHDNLVGRINNSLQFLPIIRKIPIDVLVSEPQDIESLAAFHNIGNCSFLDRRDDCPVRIIATYGGIPQHKNANSLFHASCIYLEKKFLCGLSYSTKKITKHTALQISADIKQEIIKEISYIQRL